MNILSDQAIQTVTIIVSIIIANWATVGPLSGKIIKFTWEKSIQWRDMVRDISDLQNDVVTLQKDLKAAHDKIRTLEQQNQLVEKSNKFS